MPFQKFDLRIRANIKGYHLPCNIPKFDILSSCQFIRSFSYNLSSMLRQIFNLPFFKAFIMSSIWLDEMLLNSPVFLPYILFSKPILLSCDWQIVYFCSILEYSLYGYTSMGQAAISNCFLRKDADDFTPNYLPKFFGVDFIQFI